jgi:hypothetical protein
VYALYLPSSSWNSYFNENQISDIE